MACHVNLTAAASGSGDWCTAFPVDTGCVRLCLWMAMMSLLWLSFRT